MQISRRGKREKAALTLRGQARTKRTGWWWDDAVAGLREGLEDNDESDRAGTKADVLGSHAELLTASVHHDIRVSA